MEECKFVLCALITFVCGTVLFHSAQLTVTTTYYTQDVSHASYHLPANKLFRSSVLKNFVSIDVIRDESQLTYCQGPGSGQNDTIFNSSVNVEVNEEVSELELAQWMTKLSKGGLRQMKTCIPYYRVAIIVPYRDRAAQLPVFLAHMHKFLEGQPIDYQIFIMEQADHGPFNRAMLFNIGYTKALRRGNFTCFIFSDVDLVPINSALLYNCAKSPKHMSAYVDKLHEEYLVDNGDASRYFWASIFGGVVAFSKEHFTAVNGFSNVYFGWGGEDDDIHVRCRRKGLSITRFVNRNFLKKDSPKPSSPLAITKVARFHALDHKPHAREETNRARAKYLKTARLRQDYDGLNCLLYETVAVSDAPLYTLIKVKLDSKRVVASVESQNCTDKGASNSKGKS